MYQGHLRCIRWAGLVMEVISGTLVGSKPALLATQAVQQLKQHNIDAVSVNFKDYDLEFCDGRPIDHYNKDTQDIMQLLAGVQGFIISTTILHGSIPGVLKNFFEVLPVSTFENKVMGFIASAGNDKHYLALEQSLRPLASYLNALSIPKYVFSTGSDFNQANEIVNEDVIAEIDSLIKNVIQAADTFVPNR